MERYLRALPLVALFLHGCYFDWISSPDHKSTNDATQHITGFRYNNYDEKKKIDWNIRGESSTINSDRSLNLIKPHLLLNPQETPVSIIGEKGGWNPKTLEVQIYNKVIARSDKMGVFTTQRIIYFSKTKDFKTEDPVHFRHANVSIDGTGLSGNSESEDIEIHKDVHVTILIPHSHNEKQ